VETQRASFYTGLLRRGWKHASRDNRQVEMELPGAPDGKAPSVLLQTVPRRGKPHSYNHMPNCGPTGTLRPR
jgi:hypothetical protein